MEEDVPASAQPLDFEHADVPAEAQQLTCAACSRSIFSTYYGVNGKFICPACHQRLIASRLDEGSFMAALGLGIAAAMASAGAYYAITALTGWQIGLIAIFVGVVIGKAVRKGAGLHPGMQYRVMAMLLAYMAITATYIPDLMKGDALHSVVAAMLISWALPVMMLAKMQGVLGVIILAIGVYEAWKLSAAPQLLVQGPFTLEAPVP